MKQKTSFRQQAGRRVAAIGTLALFVAILPFSSGLKRLQTFAAGDAGDNPTQGSSRGTEQDDSRERQAPPVVTQTPPPAAPTQTAAPKQDTVIPPSVIVPQAVTRQVAVVQAGYDVDTDGDGLVDAIDPDPLVPQDQYFTDTDGDGVPDALDQYPGQDDFLMASQQSNVDANGNGVLDTYEH